ncbi:MAG: protein-disulfide reductase DsbD [Pseudomonadota bacterium]
MKHRIRNGIFTLLAFAGMAHAIEPDEVREYGDVFAISAEAASADRITVRWTIADDYYLYNNRFLRFRSGTQGVELGDPLIPEGKKEFDELLGEEVIKFTGSLAIDVPLASVPAGTEQVTLNIRSQGCLEGVLCYPPTEQAVIVDLPDPALAPSLAAAPAAASAPVASSAASPLDELLGGALNVAKDPALPPDEAFRYEAIAQDAGTVLVRFTAAPGYYLYVDNFAFRVVDQPAASVAAFDTPDGTLKDDPEFGIVPVIFDQVEIPVFIDRAAGASLAVTLEAEWQGCRDGDICYPPQTGRISINLPPAAEPIVHAAAEGSGAAGSAGPDNGVVVGSAAAAAVPVSEQGRLARLLAEQPLLAMLTFFAAGLLLSFTPCVFPMIPILSGIIAGEGDRITMSRAFTLSLVYVLAMAVTYTVAGVLAGLFGQNLQAMFQNPWIISAFVLIFILLALSMFGFYELQLPSSWQTKLTEQSNRQEGGRLGGVAVMGFLSALIVGPCVAPPLAAALIFIGETGSPGLGGAALFSMSLGMGVPLIIFGTSAGKFLPRAGAWMNAVKAFFGVGLLALAIWMLERIIPGPVIMVLWGLLAVGCAVYLGALDRIPDGATGWARLWKATGVSLLFFGAIQFVGAASGGDYWLKPLDHLARGGSGAAQVEQVAFRKIKSLDDLDTAVTQANGRGMPAMLDFYADWCVECIRMERNTFPEPEVQALLGQMQPLKADVTENDDVDQALMREYGIIGPPGILFFDRDGREMENYRLVGYFNPEEFSAHLQRVIAAY